jgi:transposase-like protein
MTTRRLRSAQGPRSAFAGFRFPHRRDRARGPLFLRFGLSYRNVEELLAQRSIRVDHVTIYRWVLRFTPLLAKPAPMPARRGRSLVRGRDLRQGRRALALRLPGDRPVRAGDRAFVSARRDARAARRFFEQAIGTTKVTPIGVVTDQAGTYPIVLEELLPAASHRTDREGCGNGSCSLAWHQTGAVTSGREASSRESFASGTGPTTRSSALGPPMIHSACSASSVTTAPGQHRAGRPVDAADNRDRVTGPGP